MLLPNYSALGWSWSARGLVVRAFASQSVDLGLIPGRGRPKDFKSWYSQLPCLTFNILKGLVWR